MRGATAGGSGPDREPSGGGSRIPFRRYRFGEFELCESTCTLSERGIDVALEPQPFNLLRYLIRNRDRIVSKDELLQALWPGVAVSDAALASAVNAARAAVGDSGNRQKAIATYRRRGYRFVAEVACDGGDVGHPAVARGRYEPSGDFVGRDAELGSLRRAFEEASAGRCLLVSVTGEPGIGKTTVCEEFSELASADGALVLWAHCNDGPVATYHPWVEILRSLSTFTDSVYELRAAELADGIVRSLMAGELDLPSTGRTQDPVSPLVRLELFDATARCIETACHARTVVVIIDDLHWADGPSLELLRFMLRELRHTRLLVVVTFRDAAPRSNENFARALGSITSLRQSHTIMCLPRWTRSEIADYATQALGSEVPQAVVSEIAERSAGNPLFVRELTRHLSSRGTLARRDEGDSFLRAVPDSLVRVVQYRMADLTEVAGSVLRVCAVFGARTPRSVVRAVTGLSDLELIAALAECEGSALIEMGDDHGIAFAHAITREAVYSATSSAERAVTHLAIAKCLQAKHTSTSNADTAAATLAHHFRLSLTDEGKRSALHYTRVAARAASATGALEEATRCYRSALEQMEEVDGVGDLERCDLLLDFAEASSVSGPTLETLESIEAAWRIARESDDDSRTVRAALAMSSWVPPVIENRRGIEMLDETLREVGEIPEAVRARLLGQLALLSNASGDRERAELLLTEARALAGSLEAPQARCRALYHELAVREQSTPGVNIAERLRLADTVYDRAKDLGLTGIAFETTRHRVSLMLQSGDAVGLRRALDDFVDAGPFGRPRAHRYFVRCYAAMKALLSGDFSTAPALIAEAEEYADPFDPTLSRFVPTTQRYLLPDEYRDDERLEVEISSIVRDYSGIDAWKTALAGLYSRQRRFDSSRPIFEELASRNFQTLRHNMLFLVSYSALAEIAWREEIRDGALVLYEGLLPYAGMMITTGWGAACYGPVEHYLGLLSTVMDSDRDPAAHFERALVLEQRFQARPFELATRAAFARHLLRRRVRGDANVEKAKQLLRECVELADDMGIESEARSARELLDQVRAGSPR